MRERGLLNLGYRVPPAGRQRGVFRVGEFSTGTMGNFQPELTQMSDSSENLQKRARLRHDRNVEAVSSFGVRSPYRPGVTRGTTGPALRQIERQRCREMGQQSGVFSLEPCACCPVLPCGWDSADRGARQVLAGRFASIFLANVIHLLGMPGARPFPAAEDALAIADIPNNAPEDSSDQCRRPRPFHG